MTLDHDTIARRAYATWMALGRPEGRDDEIWLRAKADLAEEQAEAERFARAFAPMDRHPASEATVRQIRRRRLKGMRRARA